MIYPGTETSGIPGRMRGPASGGRLCRRSWAARLDQSSAAAGAGVGRGADLSGPPCPPASLTRRGRSLHGASCEPHTWRTAWMQQRQEAGQRWCTGRPPRVLHSGRPLASRGSLLTSPGQSSFWSTVLEAEGSLNSRLCLFLGTFVTSHPTAPVLTAVTWRTHVWGYICRCYNQKEKQGC